MMKIAQPTLMAADLEGVFLPEIWIAVAEKTGIEQLRMTTRDVADYDELMCTRLRILEEHNLTIHDIQKVISTMEPLPGAVDFMDWVRTQSRLIILTDSYYDLLVPFMPKLKSPTIFAHRLEIAADGRITGYRLRTQDGKRKAVYSFKELGFQTIAVGDSYNDTYMLAEADLGVLFCPPANVIADFPHFPVAENYDDMRQIVSKFVVDAESGIESGTMSNSTEVLA